MQIPNLNQYSFLLTAARAGHNSLVVCPLPFAQQHLIIYPKLITRDSTIAAVDSVHNFEVFRAFVQAWPEALSVDMSYVVDPLAHAIVKHRLDLVEFLLEVRADPNRRCGAHSRAGHHPRQSVEVGGPLETVKVLLRNGVTVRGSSASQKRSCERRTHRCPCAACKAWRQP